MRHVGSLEVGNRIYVRHRRPGREGTALTECEVSELHAEGFSYRSVYLHDNRVRLTGFRRWDEEEGPMGRWEFHRDRAGVVDLRATRGYYGFDQGRVLLIGEAPNRWIENHRKYGHCLVREDLADLCGVGFPDPFVRLFARTNVLPTWPGPGPGGKGAAFPMADAKRAAQDLKRLIRWSDFDRVVVLGRRVEEALVGTKPKHDWFQPFPMPTLPSPTAYVVPHPSKVSHWWNQAANVVEAREFWSELADFAADHVFKTGRGALGRVEGITIAETKRGPRMTMLP